MSQDIFSGGGDPHPLAPSIHDLPPEIMSHVFVLGPSKDAIENEYKIVETNVDGTKKLSTDWEILVSHVCHRWRDVALQNPTLWSSIDFTKGMERATAYLQRTQGVPLQISIDNGFNYHNPLALVIPHVSRWRTFKLVLPDALDVVDCVTQLGACTAAPLLTELWLENNSVSDSGPTEAEMYWSLFCGQVPKLTRVYLRGTYLPWDSTCLLHGLVQLELAYHDMDHRPNFNAFVRMLRSSPELHTLILRQSGPSGDPAGWWTDGQTGATGATSISLPSVKKVVLEFDEGDARYILSLLKRLQFPNVDELDLNLRYDDYNEFICSLARPSPATGKALLSGLKTLKVEIPGFHLDDLTVADAYAALANVETLKLESCVAGNRWHRYLIRPPPSSLGVVCPRLVTLICTGLQGRDLSHLVRARRAAGVPLRRLLVNTHETLGFMRNAWLSRNVKVYQRFAEEVEDLEDNASDTD